MLLKNKLVLSLTVALAFFRAAVVQGQEVTDADADTDGNTDGAVAPTTTASVSLEAACSSDAFQTCLQGQCSSSDESQDQALQTQMCSTDDDDDGSATATDGSSRNLASSGATTRTSGVGSTLHPSTSSAGSAAVSGAIGSASSLATSGSDKAIDMNKIIGFGAVSVGIIFGALSV